MKKNYLFLAAMLAFGSANAQITITNNGYVNTGIDTLSDIANLSAFSSLGTPATNANWDLGSATYASNSSYYFKNNLSGNPFPSSDYSYIATYNFSALQYTTNMYVKMNATGIMRLGEDKLNRDAISIGAMTTNMADSLVFPAQTINFSSSATELAFPATMGTSWSSSYSATTKFNLTVTLAGLNNALGERRGLFNYKDTVVGWGKMRVKDTRTGVMSAWMDVLQVREYVTVRDSFYINGAPAPTTLLTAFSLMQGQISSNYRMKYYRAGEQYPLAYVEFSNSSFSGSPSSVHTNQMRLAAPVAVHNFAGIGEVRVYPNPTSGVLHLSAQGASGSMSYALYNVGGQTLASGTAALNGEIALPAGLSAGNYYLRLSDGNNAGVYPVVLQ